MYTKLGDVTLKTGERVEAGVVLGPDPAWAPRLQSFLGHKDGIYRWQVERLLVQDVGIQPYFYVLHRAGAPLSHIMTIERDGVGILGHVFTQPADRRKSATTLLMAEQMSHFRDRAGRAMYLGTGFDSPPYHIYAGFGFAGIYAGSGVMACFPQGECEFERDYFVPGSTVIEPLDWRHYPSSAPLFVGDYPGVVRCAAAKMCSRYLCEGPMLPLLLSEADRRARDLKPQVAASRHQTTGAVVGLASCLPDPLWQGVSVLDVYCHPSFWADAPRLLEAVEKPSDRRVIAYVDSQNPHRADAFRAVGFSPRGRLFTGLQPPGCDDRIDIAVYERE